MACLEEDVRKMPMGLHTIVTEGGGGFSGGQKQRILIARALISKPNIIFFDEATSALDNISQKAVSDNLDQLNCTRVVIAHRLSTIRHCDRIIVLDKGKIAEEGTFEELMEKKELFFEMANARYEKDDHDHSCCCNADGLWQRTDGTGGPRSRYHCDRSGGEAGVAAARAWGGADRG